MSKKARQKKKNVRKIIRNAILKNGWNIVDFKKAAMPEIRISDCVPDWDAIREDNSGHRSYLLESAEKCPCAVLEFGTGLRRNGFVTLWVATRNWTKEEDGTWWYAGTAAWQFMNPFTTSAKVDDDNEAYHVEALGLTECTR